jgi:hypothetical protein
VSNHSTDSESKRIAEKFIIRIYSSQPVVVEREATQSPYFTSTSTSSSSFVPSSSFAPSSPYYGYSPLNPPSQTPSTTHPTHPTQPTHPTHTAHTTYFTHPTHPTYFTHTTHNPPSISSLSLLRFVQSALSPLKFQSHCSLKSLKTKKLLIFNMTNNQFQADNKNQKISFNNNQISPIITDINRYSGLIDLSEDGIENELISNAENNSKKRKFSTNNIIYQEKSGIVDLTSDCSSNVPKNLEIISFLETEYILILVAVNKSSNNTKIEIEIETCNYNVTCPFAEKNSDFSVPNFPSNFHSDIESRENKNLYNDKKKKSDEYNLDFILFPNSNRIIGIFVSAPLGQIMSSVRTDSERTVNDPQRHRGIEMGSSSIVKILSTKVLYIDNIDINRYNNTDDNSNNNDINNNKYPEKDFLQSGMPYHFAICSISE